jgi:indole-3-glycerol phosphate synthase
MTSSRIPSAIAAVALVILSSSIIPSSAFAPPGAKSAQSRYQTTTPCTTSSTALNALGVFVRKAKEADVRQYCQDGPPESVLTLLQKIKDASGKEEEGDNNKEPGELQSLLTKRKGTITIIAEYKRKIEGSGFLKEILDPELLSSVFREFGAAAVAVLADERTGGCSYDDVVAMVEEQEEARGDVPGPLPVISSDLIVDEIQIAQAADAGAKAVTVTYGVVGEEKVKQFIKDAAALDLEVIVNVGSAEEAQGAVNAGASIISVTGVDGADGKFAVVESLSIPEGRSVCTVANILARENKALEEVEEAWMCRDLGFNCVWVSDALYKAGNDPVEHPGAIIRSMKAKSSVKYASPKARSGKGEGAREYLGDILM